MRNACLAIVFFLAALFAGAAPASAQMAITRGNSAEPETLDPNLSVYNWETNISGDLMVGLLTDDAAAKPIAGIATKWETSPDGKTWTFHLRDALWSDGKPVTAQDFIFSWQRELDPKTASNVGYYLWLLKGARAISAGKAPPSSLGVTAPNDKTLVVTLEHPAPYLPQLLTHATMFPVPRHVVMAKGRAWSKPGNYVSNGPYLLKEWVANDHVTLVKNPRFYDAAHVRIDRVAFLPTQDSSAALKRLRAGEIDTQFPIPSTAMDWIKANMAPYLRRAPGLSNTYLTINFGRAPLKDVRLREALNLAIDRETIVNKVSRLGSAAAYSLVPPNVENYPSNIAMAFKPMPMPARIARAQQLMAAMGYGPGHHLHLAYATATTPDALRNAAVLQSMWRQIYIDADIQQFDVQVLYRNMQLGQFDIGVTAWVADFDDASNFLDILRRDSGNNWGKYNNPAFDAAMDAAQQLNDVKARSALLAKAETIALKDYAVIPLSFPLTQTLVAPYVKGWLENGLQYNRDRWLWIEGKPAPR